MAFHRLFQTPDPERNAFLAQILGLLSADIVRCWAAAAQSPYDLLGVPVLRAARAKRGYPLDFVLTARKHAYVAVMKADPLVDLPLAEPEQVAAYKTTRQFEAFLEAAAQPDQYVALIDKTEQPINGAILVWSSLGPSQSAIRAIKKAYQLQDILALDDMIADLLHWQNRDFQMLLDRRFAWNHDFFRGLRQLK
jgi:hypothetical protein